MIVTCEECMESLIFLIERSTYEYEFDEEIFAEEVRKLRWYLPPYNYPHVHMTSFNVDIAFDVNSEDHEDFFMEDFDCAAYLEFRSKLFDVHQQLFLFHMLAM